MENFSTELIKMSSVTPTEPKAFDGSTHLQLLLRDERISQKKEIIDIAERAGLPEDLLTCIEDGIPYGISPSTFEKLSVGYNVHPSLLINIIKLDVDDGHAAVFEDIHESNDRIAEENI